jgi:hypothetical protein
MADDLIRYDILAQEALRGLVKRVIGEVAQAGLPGEHHFFISFDTRHPGVRISDRLRNDYPTEMTVVLQHQFWDLAVGESSFEVGLSFKGVPERLVVPFAAIGSFVDPHASFALKFEVAAEPATSGIAAPGAKEAAESTAAAPVDLAKPEGAAAVVSLDAFRKKNA